MIKEKDLLDKQVTISVSAERFELSTNGLKGHCSAIELRAQNGLHFNMAGWLRQRNIRNLRPI